MGFGLERIREIVKENYSKEEIDSIIKRPDYVIVTELKKENNIHALKIAEKLREKGKVVLLNNIEKSFNAQMKSLNKLRARNAIIIGEDEIKGNYYTIKDLDKGVQEKKKEEEI